MKDVRIRFDVGEAWTRVGPAVQRHLLARGIASSVATGIPLHESDIAVLSGPAVTRAADAGFELLAAPVALGARYKSRPIGFYDVVVQRERGWLSLHDAARVRIAWNERDPSLSTVRSLVLRIVEREGIATADVSSCTEHHALESVASGSHDLAVVDSLALEHWRRDVPSLAPTLRVLQSLGPNPGPAWVARRALPHALRRQLRAMLLEMHRDTAGQRALAECALARFVGVHPLVGGPERLQSGFREATGGSAE